MWINLYGDKLDGITFKASKKFGAWRPDRICMKNINT